MLCGFQRSGRRRVRGFSGRNEARKVLVQVKP